MGKRLFLKSDFILSALIICIVVFLHVGKGYVSERRFLFEIEVQPISGAPEDRFEIRLFHREADQLERFLTEDRGYGIEVKKEYVAILNKEYSFSRDRSHLKIEPSFINDFNHPVFSKLREAIISKYGEKPSDEDLIKYVNQYIEKKNYKRLFDFASVIAERKEGDCTEHSILLVSVMRMFKIPFHMVFGIKLFKVGDQFSAVGHAWWNTFITACGELQTLHF